MNLERRMDETPFEYKLRICLGKLDKEIDLDWCEIVELLGLNCSSDHLRKLSYAYREYSEYVKDKRVLSSDMSLVDQLVEKKLELEKERKKLQATKIEYHKNIRNESRFDLLYENIKEAMTRITPPELVCNIYHQNEREYVLALSDIHFGANFKSVNNEYSIEICKERFQALLGELREYILDNDVDRVKVLNNGDSLQGLLRISDVLMNEVPVVDSLVMFSQLMAKFLNELSQFCEIEYIHTPSANHTQTRNLGTKANELAREDMEKIIVNYIADMLMDNTRVIVHRETESDRIMFKVFDYDCIAMHGHQIKNVNSALKDLSLLHKKFFSYVFLGHFHASRALTVGEGDVNMEVLITPSFIGSCPYSDSLMVGSKAMAQLYVFDREKGHIATQNIILN